MWKRINNWYWRQSMVMQLIIMFVLVYGLFALVILGLVLPVVITIENRSDYLTTIIG